MNLNERTKLEYYIIDRKGISFKVLFLIMVIDLAVSIPHFECKYANAVTSGLLEILKRIR